MRLELAFGANWQREMRDGVRVYAAPGFAFAPDMFVEVWPLATRRVVSAEDVLARDLPADAELRRSPIEQLTTATGWPITLHHATVHRPDGQLLEIRVVARYEIAVLAAIVRLRTTNEARYAQHREQFHELLASAKPDLESSEPAAIAELWDMTERG